MPKISTWVSWESYRKISQRCVLLTKKEGKKVTIYEFMKRAIEKALREGLEPS